ncbi:MAG: hypothetical protein R2854_01440 [Caldilineaceae bacterium]
MPLESCGDIAPLALDAALDDMTDRQGANMDRWAWSKVHITQYPHTPFSQVPALKPFFARSIRQRRRRLHGQRGTGGRQRPLQPDPRAQLPQPHRPERLQREPFHAHHRPVGQRAQPAL